MSTDKPEGNFLKKTQTFKKWDGLVYAKHCLIYKGPHIKQKDTVKAVFQTQGSC